MKDYNTYPDELATEMTKREEFAKAAMQGLCAQSGYGDHFNRAYDAVRHADELIAELNKTTEETK